MDLVVTDVETSGLDPEFHEILEIGAVRCDADTLEQRGRFELKVKPSHLMTADPMALMVNGYNETDWNSAVPIETALKRYVAFAKGAIFTAHNVAFDWSFLRAALLAARVPNELDYHHLDVGSMAYYVWPLISHEPRGFKLDRIAMALGIEPEPMPHRALNGAVLEYRVICAVQMNVEEALRKTND